MSWPRFRFWLIELAAYWLEAEPADREAWLPFVQLAMLAFAVEGIAALWIMGALSPL